MHLISLEIKMDLVNDVGNKIKNAQREFLNFTAYNNMLILCAAAICVGLATKEAISDIMHEIILPLILFFGKRSLDYFVYLKALEHSIHLPWLHYLIKGIGKLICIFLVWLIILYITYIIFKGIIKIDIVSDKVNIVQGTVNYIGGRGYTHS